MNDKESIVNEASQEAIGIFRFTASLHSEQNVQVCFVLYLPPEEIKRTNHRLQQKLNRTSVAGNIKKIKLRDEKRKGAKEIFL